jgi:hypothetical protein
MKTLLHKPLGEDEDSLMRTFLALVGRSEPEIVYQRGGEEVKEKDMDIEEDIYRFGQ